MKKADIESHLASPDVKSFSGTVATFIPLNDEWGIKLFNYKLDRDISLANQKKAYKCGVAPKYGRKVNLVWQNEKCYGYLCERVYCCDSAIFDYYKKEHPGICRWSRKANYFAYCESGDKYNTFLEENLEWGLALEELDIKLQDEGINFTDRHAGNWGITKDGKPVLVDFDRCIYFGQ